MPVEAKPLFRPDVLRSHLSGFQLPAVVDPLRPKLAHWAELIANGRIDGFKEQEILPDFLTDFFVSLLGYVRPADGHDRYWAKPEHYDIFTKCVPRIARDPQRRMSGYKIAHGLRAAPGAFLFYAGGISALAANNYGMFAHLMGASVCRDDGKEGPFVIVYPWNDLHRFAQRIPGGNHRYAADSKWLFDRLREPLRPLLVGDDEYELTFDRFEYLRSLVYIDLKANKHGDDEVHDRNVPIGLFLWRDRSDGRRQITIQTDLMEEFEVERENWGPLRVGLFGGTSDRFKEHLLALKKCLQGEVFSDVTTVLPLTVRESCYIIAVPPFLILFGLFDCRI